MHSIHRLLHEGASPRVKLRLLLLLPAQNRSGSVVLRSLDDLDRGRMCLALNNVLGIDVNFGRLDTRKFWLGCDLGRWMRKCYLVAGAGGDFGRRRFLVELLDLFGLMIRNLVISLGELCRLHGGVFRENWRANRHREVERQREQRDALHW